MAKISDEAHRVEMAARRLRQHARKPGWAKRMAGGGGTPNGRNHSRASIGRLKAKWLAAPTDTQVHPERHTHPRRKRAA